MATPKCCDALNSPAAMRHRIEIQSLSLVANDSGGQAETWTTFANCWASITPKIVKEMNFGQRIDTTTDFDIRIRYLAGLKQSMRIMFGTRIFQIKSFIIIEEVKEFIQILGSEGPGT